MTVVHTLDSTFILSIWLLELVLSRQSILLVRLRFTSELQLIFISSRCITHISALLTFSSFLLVLLTEKRVEGSAKIRSKYPDRVACIVEAARKDDPILEQRKFLVPSDSTVAKFIFQIRKQMKLDDHENVFVFVGENQQQPIGTALMIDVYQHNKYAPFHISPLLNYLLTFRIGFCLTEMRTASCMLLIARKASSANYGTYGPYFSFCRKYMYIFIP